MEFFENIRKISSYFDKSVENKKIENIYTGGCLPTGSSAR